MRILIVTNNRGLVGGVETYLQTLMPALASAGHTVALLYHADAPDGKPAIDDDLQCDAVWSDDGVNSDHLLEKLASWHPSVVYLHDPPSLELHAALLERYAVVLFAHAYYGACPTGRKMHVFPVPIPCSRACGSACLALHYTRRCGGLNPITMINNYREGMAQKALLPRHAAIIVASRHMRAEYLRQGVSPQRLHVVPLYPASKLQADAQAPLARAPQGRVLFIGRVVPGKGVDYLIRALYKAQDRLPFPLTLTVVGSGPKEKSLRALANGLQVAVEFSGWLDSKERVRRMREADLLAVPSIWPEPFGMVGLEAGCVGLPAVAYATGGIPDWLAPGESGELAPPNPPTVSQLADAIVRALGDPRHYQDLRWGAWNRARSFTLASHLQQSLPILETAAQLSRPAHAETYTATRCNL